MKAYWKWLVAAALAIGAAAVLSEALAQGRTAAAAKPTRVGVCDIVAVFNGNDKANDLREMLEKKRKAIQAEDEKRAKAIQASQEELAAYKKGSGQYEKMLNEIQRLSYERKAWLEFQNAMILREYQRLTREMYDEILQVIAQVARQGGIDVVIYTERDMPSTDDRRELLSMIERRKVLFAADDVDITSATLAALNKAYARTKNR